MASSQKVWPNRSVPSIESVLSEEDLRTFESVEQRYYTRYFYRQDQEDNNKNEDHVVLVHSNRVCLVCLAPRHPVVKDKKAIESLDFSSTKKDRLSNQAVGKGKKGAQVLEESSVICQINCKDGDKFTVRSCVRGKLIGINQALIGRPDLLVSDPLGDGHIAIVLPKIPEGIDDIKKRLLTQEAYDNNVGEQE